LPDPLSGLDLVAGEERRVTTRCRGEAGQRALGEVHPGSIGRHGLAAMLCGERIVRLEQPPFQPTLRFGRWPHDITLDNKNTRRREITCFSELNRGFGATVG
jgi:hypothetical protein